MAEAATETFRLIYRSRNLIPEDQRKTELGSLFGQARSNNKRQGITGALLLSDDWFVQTLEGDEEAVRALFDQIEKDSRHGSVAVIETGRAVRVFSKWAMARVAADGERDIALIAHVDGIHRAAPQRTTGDQESVLDVMRSAARGN
jgi:Sensors of blue-light using FAD